MDRVLLLCIGFTKGVRLSYAGGPRALSMQPLQEVDVAHGRHHLPFNQGAADALVSGHPPDREGEERRLVGGTRPPAGGQAADGLGMNHKIMAVMARREGQARLGGRDRRPRLLERVRRGCLQPSGDQHRLGTQGGPRGLVQMGQHGARQHQERDRRDLPQDRPRPCRALPRKLSLGATTGATNSRP